MATRLEKGERHQQILERSLDLFLRRGYDATSAREIAQASQMSKANLYHHFPAKDDVLRELLEPLFEEIEDLLDRSDEHADTAKEREDLLQDFMETLLKYRKTFTLLETNVSIESRPDLHEKSERLRERGLTILVGENASEESLVRAESTLGAIRYCIINSDRYHDDILRKTGLEAALRALGSD